MPEFSDFAEILRECTTEFRKGERIVEESTPNAQVVHVYDMPHVDEAPEGLAMHDLTFVWIGVDKAAAERNRERILEECRRWPDPERLASGPSYIEVGAQVGSQDAALCFFALGAELGLWSVVTPETLGFEGQEALNLAGRGFLMISGYQGNPASAS